MREPDGPNVSGPPDAGYLALERTRLANERTLLAWVRTAIALITFGFAVYKFFQFLHESEPPRRLQRPFGPAEFALTMIGIGLVALLLAILKHRRNLRIMRAHDSSAPFSLAGLFAGLVACMGIAGFVAVIFRQ